MSQRLVLAGVCASLALSACSKPVDDPTNIPLLGRWEGSTEIPAVEVNGRSYMGKNMPSELRSIAGLAERASRNDKLSCAEPKMRTAEEIKSNLPSRIAKLCSVETDEISTGTFTMTGQCDKSQLPAGVTGMSFYGTTKVTSDKLDMKFNVSISATDESRGTSERVRISLHKKLERVGDCKA